MKKKKCDNCKKNYTTLTKKGICSFCHKEETGQWSEEFGRSTKEKEGKKWKSKK